MASNAVIVFIPGYERCSMKQVYLWSPFGDDSGPLSKRAGLGLFDLLLTRRKPLKRATLNFIREIMSRFGYTVVMRGEKSPDKLTTARPVVTFLGKRTKGYFPHIYSSYPISIKEDFTQPGKFMWKYDERLNHVYTERKIDKRITRPFVAKHVAEFGYDLA